MAASERLLRWDAVDEQGRWLGPGLYFLKLESPLDDRVRRMVVLE